jgi:hypothetical protein
MMHIGFLGSRHGSSVVLLGRPAAGFALSRYQSGKPVLGLTGPALTRPSDGSGSLLMMLPAGPAKRDAGEADDEEQRQERDVPARAAAPQAAHERGTWRARCGARPRLVDLRIRTTVEM